MQTSNHGEQQVPAVHLSRDSMQSSAWVLVKNTTANITHQRDWMFEYTPFQDCWFCAINGSRMRVAGKGTVILTFVDINSSSSLRYLMSDVLHIPDAPYNTISPISLQYYNYETVEYVQSGSLMNVTLVLLPTDITATVYVSLIVTWISEFHAV